MTPALRHVTKISSLSPKEIKGVLKLALEMKARAGVLCRAVEESTRVKFSLFVHACIDVAKHATSARRQGRRTTGTR